MDMFRLIAEVKRRPALWDSTHPEHANRLETQQQWQSVAEALGANVDVCRAKWKNLRCSYRRQQHRKSQQSPLQSMPNSTAAHRWLYADAMSFLDGCRLRRNDSNDEEEDFEDLLALKMEPTAQLVDAMEADNDALMQEFQTIVTPQALRRLSHSISLASAAAEEQAEQQQPTLKMSMAATAASPASSTTTATALAAGSSCQCARRVDEQVHFLEDLEREEQQLMQSTSQDISRCKNVLHVGDSDYNYLVSFLPMMKQMSPLQNVAFRAKMGELLLQTMAAGAAGALPQQQQQLQQQQQQQQNQQTNMALENAQVSTTGNTSCCN